MVEMGHLLFQELLVELEVEVLQMLVLLHHQVQQGMEVMVLQLI
tara:strand:+ start:136 stop:267 length:132 start_codon:yes stop_codon:yes gene_type:complete